MLLAGCTLEVQSALKKLHCIRVALLLAVITWSDSYFLLPSCSPNFLPASHQANKMADKHKPILNSKIDFSEADPSLTGILTQDRHLYVVT